MSDERLDRILEATYSCFTRHGVRRTTMDDIATTAAMSRPAVYQYVRSKDDAYRSLAKRLFDQALADAAAAAGSSPDLTAQLIGVLSVKLELTLRLWRDSPHAAELVADSTRLAADLAQEYNDGMRDLLAATTAAHGDVPTDPAELAELLLAFTRGLEADLTDPQASPRRLRQGVRLLVLGLSRVAETT